MLRSACFYRPFCGTQDPVRLSVRPVKTMSRPWWQQLPSLKMAALVFLPLYTLFTKDFFLWNRTQATHKVNKDLRDKPHGKASLSNTHPLACGTFFHSSLTYFHTVCTSIQESNLKPRFLWRPALGLKVDDSAHDAHISVLQCSWITIWNQMFLFETSLYPLKIRMDFWIFF